MSLPKCPPDVEAHDVEPGKCCHEAEVHAVPCTGDKQNKLYLNCERNRWTRS